MNTPLSNRMFRKMTRPAGGVLLGVALFALAGCGVSRMSVFPPERSDLLTLAKEAKGRAFEVLGVIQVDGRNFTLESTLVNRLRDKAREIGADEVLAVRVLSIPRGSGLFNGGLRYHMFTVEGIAVRWKSVSERSVSGRPALTSSRGEPAGAIP